MLKNLRKRKNEVNKTNKDRLNNLFKKINYKTNGITLIALVITIIVLLILAGVSIATLTGDNGILTQANKAKTETEKAGAQEKVELEVTGSYGKTGDIDLNLLNNNLKNNVKGLTYKGAAISETNKITSLPAIVEVDGYKIQITGEGNVGEIKTVTDISDYVTKDTTVTDDYGNSLIVPEDFKIRIDDTTNNADTVNEGIVVEDRNGNQFVWVPVGDVKTDSEGTTVNITLGRYDFADGSDSYKDADGNVLAKGTPIPYSGSCTEDTEASHNSSYGNAIAKNITNFVNNSNSNHGYYIGRYEAGVANYDTSNIVTSNSESNPKWTGYNKVSGGEDLKLVCKTGQQVWNYVTQNKASELARNMYTGKKYESDLINSYAWDTAILFIQKCGTKTNHATYSREIGLSTDTSKPALTGTGKLSSTNAVDEQCNIYDMAGNDYEWTTETYSGSRPCVSRGSSYANPYVYTSNRDNNSTTDANGHNSFRPLLYW